MTAAAAASGTEATTPGTVGASGSPRPGTPAASEDILRPPAGMPAPPWARADAKKPKAASRTPLSQEAIVDAAMQVLDTEGYDALSMRRVAAELGTGAASLYAHVSNKDELLDLMIDRVMAEFDFPEPDPAHWQEQVKQAIRDQRRVFQAHPGIARAVLGRIPLGPNGMRSMEKMLGVVRAGNLPDKAATWFGDTIALYVTAEVFEESLQSQSAPDFTPEKIQGWLDGLKSYIRSLPADQFPNMIETVDTMFEYGGPDARFEFGLDLMVRGLASYAKPDEAVSDQAAPES
jgi:AcrR family transcriptional regulator